MKKMNKIIALLLAASMLTATVGALEVQPIESQQETSIADTLSNFLLNKIQEDPTDIAAIKDSASDGENQPQRAPVQPDANSSEIDTEELEDNELNLQLTDGTYSFYSFSEDIKFTDENGIVQYKDTTIVPQTDQELVDAGYTYTNGTNDFRINFAPAVDKGVYTEYDKIKIGFIPVPNEAEYAKNGQKNVFLLDGDEVDSFEYPDVFGEGTILRYTAQLNALKKDIILPEYTGQNTFRFILDTYGSTAVLSEDGKKIQIFDPETNELLQEFAPIYAYDSFGGYYSDDYHYTEDCHYTLSLRDDGRYDMGVVVSEEYLANPDLIYPVTIDPSNVSLTNLQDAPVYSAQPGTNWRSATTMCCGRSSVNGSGRSYIKFDVSPIGANADITAATLTLRETTGRTTSTTIGVHMSSGPWTEAGLNWNNRPGYNNLQSSNNINSPAGNYFYDFNVKFAVQQWVNGYSNDGFAIVSEDETNTRNFWRAFATKEYSTSSFRPVLKVSYIENVTGGSIPNGVYFIRNQNSGKYIDVQGGYTTSGANIGQWHFTEEPQEQWKITYVGGGWYTIRPQHAPNMAMDVADASTANDANIWQYTYNGSDAQKFGFVKLSNGAYRIVTKVTNGQKNLSVNSISTEAGANIAQYEYVGGTNDHWFLERALVCDSFYDNGYEQRWGSNTLSKLQSYENMVKNMYYDQFDIRLVFTNTKYRSTADDCLGVSSATINQQCNHSLGGKACGLNHPDQLHHKYTDFASAYNIGLGRSGIGYTTVSWMGHVTCDSGCTGSNHNTGACLGITIRGNVIILQATDYNRDYHSATTLAHEIAHVFGIGGGLVDTTHDSNCVMSYNTKYDSQRMYDRWSTGNYSQSFCATCKNSLLSKLP